MEATLTQATQLLKLVSEQKVSFDRLQALFDSGLISTLLKADITELKKARGRIEQILNLMPLTQMLLVSVGRHSFGELIAKGRYDYINPSVTEAGTRFLESAEQEDRTITFISFNEEMSPAEVELALHSQGLEACSIEELLSIGLQHPFLQCKKSIVCLNYMLLRIEGVTTDIKAVLHPCLFGSAKERRLGMVSDDEKFTTGFQFACVPLKK